MPLTELGAEADLIVDDTNKIANEVKEKLELMVKTDTTGNSHVIICIVYIANRVITASVKQMQAQAAEERIKKNTHASLVQQFVEIMQHYQGVQAKYKQQYQDNVRRQILVGTCHQRCSDGPHLLLFLCSTSRCD